MRTKWHNAGHYASHSDDYQRAFTDALFYLSRGASRYGSVHSLQYPPVQSRRLRRPPPKHQASGFVHFRTDAAGARAVEALQGYSQTWRAPYRVCMHHPGVRWPRDSSYSKCICI